MSNLVAVRPAPTPPEPAATSPWRWRLLLLGVGVAALWVRLSAVHSAGLGGLHGYDDGVYYAASTSLVSGRLPYRDFVLLHPPGIAVLLAPLALVGRLTSDAVGFEAARLASMVASSLDAVLLAVVARRAGVAAAASAGLAYAVWTPAVRAGTSIRLEPWVTLGLTGALVLLTAGHPSSRPRRLLLAGFLVGAACSVKIWALAPALLLGVWCWRKWGGRGLWPMVGGAVVATSVIDVPFFVAAPSTMVRMVLIDQFGRARTPTSVPARVLSTLLDGRVVHLHPAAAGWVLVLLVMVAGPVLALSARSPVGRLALALAAVELGVLALSPTFFSYYREFAAPGLALVVACSAAAMLDVFRTAGATGAIPRSARRVLAGTALLAMAVGAARVIETDAGMGVGTAFPARELATATRNAWCVTSDSPSALLLTDRYTRDLRRGCVVPVDLSGLTLDRDSPILLADGRPVSRVRDAAWQRDLTHYLFSGQMVFVLRPHEDEFDASLAAELHVLTMVARGPGFRLLRNAAVGPPGR